MPILVVLIVGLHSGLNRFAAEYNQRLQIKKQFEHYLSPPLVRQLQKHPELLKLGGETKELTLLFCDIRGFTPISEQFKQDPQGLTKLINRFLTPMTWAIMERNGTIDKYMGDCIMAFWNAPLNVPQQQTLAVSAALEMQKRLEVLNAELLLENQMPISIGTGINSGLCVVGNMGADQRFDYSALGDAVNLAARLEGQSKEYGVTIIVSDNIAFNASAEFIFVELDVVAVKGKTEGVRIFTCIGRREEEIDMPAIDLLMDNHKKYLSFYRQQLWSDAEIVARSQAEAWPIFSEYYRLMGIRIDELRKSSLPLNWDGVFRANSK
jgi:adenylate cyclase